MPFQPVILWTDAAVFVLLAVTVFAGIWSRRDPNRRDAWRRVLARPSASMSLVLLAIFLLIGLADCVHFQRALPDTGDGKRNYAAKVESLLDVGLSALNERTEKTYSAPLATHLFVKETIEQDGRAPTRDYPPLTHGGAHLGSDYDGAGADIGLRVLTGLLVGALLAALLWWAVGQWRARRGAGRAPWSPALNAGVATGAALLVLIALTVSLASGYHVFGTDKVGQDVLYLTLKSVRTALVIGVLTTIVTLPIAIVLGILAGYLGGWVDDLIQYLYTVVSSIPGVLLIAAAVLMMQVVIETHPQWFQTAAERADARLLALCVILGMTSWTSLCRLLRAETLKLRELEYVQAARSFGVGTSAILRRHILPNLMHIVLIALVMDFSSLVLAEAVLSYVGIGVDPNTISFGTMINAARMELAREPTVWWSLAAAFVVMFALVLSANLFADAVREVFDPRST